MRERILGEALGLFLTHGYAGASLREIATALGTTKAAVYYHFPAKQDILTALVSPYLDELDELATLSPGHGYRDLPDLIANLFDLLRRHAEVVALLDSDVAAAGQPDVASRLVSSEEQLRDLLVGPNPNLPGQLRATLALGALRTAATSFTTRNANELIEPAVSAVLAILGAEAVRAPAKRARR
jgi:AcrR family transcriptional regulator